MLVYRTRNVLVLCIRSLEASLFKLRCFEEYEWLGGGVKWSRSRA